MNADGRPSNITELLCDKRFDIFVALSTEEVNEHTTALVTYIYDSGAIAPETVNEIVEQRP